MKAIVYTQYGPPEVLHHTEVEKPVPKDNEVLVRILAASINQLDWHYLRGKPYFMRLMGSGFLKPKNKILGVDIAGQVEAVGKNVKRFQMGDAVFGACKFGGLAEYVCAPEI